VNCLDFKADGSLIASGATDGTVKVINVVSGKLVHTFECGKVTQTSAVSSTNQEPGDESIESVAFNAELPVLVTATVKGTIEVWDLSTFICREKIISSAGVSKIIWDKLEPFILHASCLDGSLMSWDGRTGQLLSTFYGHRDQILDFDVSETNSLIVTASEDTSCRIFDLKQNSITNDRPVSQC